MSARAQEQLESSDPQAIEPVLVPEAPPESACVPESTSSEEIPEEVLRQIGVYDTDCAGGCG
ncbi:MAG: hypothetical protein JO022_22215 [Acidobacteriaceae bacterium]|nr:hypothetical protein [Acidobacteriaceae bacterium]